MARPYYLQRAYLNPHEEVQLAMRRNTANYTRWSLLYDRLPSGPSLDGAIPFFRREVWPYLVYHYVSGTLTEGIKEVLGLSDPYTVAYSREDFFLKTSSLFSETYRDFVRARCSWYEDSDLGVRGADWVFCSSAIIYTAVSIAGGLLRDHEGMPTQPEVLALQQGGVEGTPKRTRLHCILSVSRKIVRKLFKKEAKSQTRGVEF